MYLNYHELVHKHPTHLDGAGVGGVVSMRCWFDEVRCARTTPN